MLSQMIKDLVVARQANEEARSQWQELIADGGDAAYEAMRNYREKQAVYEQVMDQLVPALSELKESGLLDDEIEQLEEAGDQTLAAFNQVVSELNLEELVKRSHKDNLAATAKAWFLASETLTAAQALNDERMGFDCDSLPELIAAFDSYIGSYVEEFGCRDEAAWRKAVSMYRATLSNLVEMDDVEERMCEATHQVVRKARAKDDQLTDLVRDILLSLQDHGSLGPELAELPDDLRHRLQRVMEAGFLPQRQVQLETKPEPRQVAVLEEVECDTEVETDIAAEVEAWLHSQPSNN